LDTTAAQEASSRCTGITSPEEAGSEKQSALTWLEGDTMPSRITPRHVDGGTPETPSTDIY